MQRRSCSPTKRPSPSSPPPSLLEVDSPHPSTHARWPGLGIGGHLRGRMFRGLGSAFMGRGWQQRLQRHARVCLMEGGNIPCHIVWTGWMSGCMYVWARRYILANHPMPLRCSLVPALVSYLSPMVRRSTYVRYNACDGDMQCSHPWLASTHTYTCTRGPPGFCHVHVLKRKFFPNLATASARAQLPIQTTVHLYLSTSFLTHIKRKIPLPNLPLHEGKYRM